MEQDGGGGGGDWKQWRMKRGKQEMYNSQSGLVREVMIHLVDRRADLSTSITNRLPVQVCSRRPHHRLV